MESIRAAALAYYQTGSEKFKHSACTFFKTFDSDEDGKVKVEDTVDFLKKRGYQSIKPSFFEALGKGEDGYLDFEEIIVVYYLVKTGWPYCKECGDLVKSVYFSCNTCFDTADRTYDICAKCYGDGRACTHEHALLMDNRLLFKLKSNAPLSNMNKQEDSLGGQEEVPLSPQPFGFGIQPQISQDASKPAHHHSHGGHQEPAKHHHYHNSQKYHEDAFKHPVAHHSSQGGHKDILHQQFDAMEKEFLSEKFGEKPDVMFRGINTSVNICALM